MDTLKLGQIIEPDRTAERDATHIAVAPVVAGMRLFPGTPVMLDENGLAMQTSVPEKSIGVVDPFLWNSVKDGERFWLFVIPGSITSLRHQWEHPAFAQKQGKDAPEAAAPLSASEEYLRMRAARMNIYCATIDEAYQTLLSDLRSGVVMAHGTDLHGAYDLDEPEEFYRHASIVLGRQIGPENMEYSCSC